MPGQQPVPEAGVGVHAGIQNAHPDPLSQEALPKGSVGPDHIQVPLLVRIVGRQHSLKLRFRLQKDRFAVRFRPFQSARPHQAAHFPLAHHGEGSIGRSSQLDNVLRFLCASGPGRAQSAEEGNQQKRCEGTPGCAPSGSRLLSHLAGDRDQWGFRERGVPLQRGRRRR